jgi:hypothetical protein
MARLLIFAPLIEDDLPLWNSHWMAQQTARVAQVSITMIERDAAVRGRLESALADAELEGVAFFGHGAPHAVIGADGREALDIANVHLVGRHRWAHAIACNIGLELVPASALHVDLFVGYDVKVNVSWPHPHELPGDLRDALAQMVTATTLALLGGVRSKDELRRQASVAVEGVVDWLALNAEEGYLAIHNLADTLVEKMVVSRTTDAWDHLRRDAFEEG